MISHPGLVGGRWATLTFAEQMGNVGSEVHRTLMWSERGDDERRDSARDRALELLDATANDPRWPFARKKELLCVREGFIGLVYGTNEQHWQPGALRSYFDSFIAVARANR